MSTFQPLTDFTDFEAFMRAVHGIECGPIGQALNVFTPGTDWTGGNKYRMAECYAQAMAGRALGVTEQTAQDLRSVDLVTLGVLAKIGAQGRADWLTVLSHIRTSTTPALNTAEAAAVLFKVPLLAAMRQELRDVSRALLRAEDRLRAAQLQAASVQQHAAGLSVLVAQVIASEGIGGNEFSCPGGWRERAECAIAQRQPLPTE